MHLKLFFLVRIKYELEEDNLLWRWSALRRLSIIDYPFLYVEKIKQ